MICGIISKRHEREGIPVSNILLWVAFNIFVVAMLLLDLKVFHRKAHEVKLKEALIWSGVWIGLSLLFNGGVYFWWGKHKALEFLTGYLIEKSLSVDNLFVFLMIFSSFGVSSRYQHKVLFWGILGALIMRGFFIAMGITLIHKFHWIIYLFGAFLILSGIKMASQKHKEIYPERNFLLRLVKRFAPMAEGYEDDQFFIRRQGRLLVTPLFLVLLVVETTDLIFAVDSIPAVLAITHDPFIVYSSNVFAILGLRALYFALSGLLEIHRYLHHGLVAILIFVGTKMLLTDIYKMPVSMALGIVGLILFISVASSMLIPPGVQVSPSPAPSPSPATESLSSQNPDKS